MPRSSLVSGLDWNEVCENEIIVKGAKAKTRQRRVVTISDNLRTWLSPHRKTSGPITLLAGKRWHAALGEAAQAATAPMSMNILRHTFGSYHFALHRNENLTAAEMGNSPAMVFRHYRAVCDTRSRCKILESPSLASRKRGEVCRVILQRHS